MVLTVLSFYACNSPKPVKVSPTQILADSSYDSHSYANIDEIYTKHLHLDLDVQFENKTIYGVARHEMINNGADTAIFDIKGLEIQKITLGKKNSEKETSYMIGQWDKDSILGQPLLVVVDSNTTNVNIYYKTTEKSSALDWLSPELTAGKKHPYLYTQGQAILTRTWIPSQDSPKNRITYSADVNVPKDLLPLMSAENPKKKNSTGKYHFEMKQPIPCYLIALAVGNIEYYQFSKNSGIYSEPEMLANCAYEFNDLPKMIATAEKLYGKYRWEQYDVLMLPYSFPYGGMENPRLTFANPTLITGDRSLVSVIAHELAHSWSGNLVTNATWNDFWLNEGFTVYFENRIMEELYTKEVSNMLMLVETFELHNELEYIVHGDHPEDTKLKLNLTERDPDAGMTQIAYIKGALFLKAIENKVGREKFDRFLKNYFNQFSFKTITTEQFIDYMNQELFEPNKIQFNTNEWVYQEGLPKNSPKIQSLRFSKVGQLAKDFAAGKDIFKKKITYQKIKGKRRKKKVVEQLTREQFVTQEWQEFIRNLPSDIGQAKMKEIDKHLNFRDCGNSEIMTEWYMLGIKNNYEALKPSIEKFLNTVGRRKYLMPIYTALKENPDWLEWGKKVYDKSKKNYHAVSTSSIDLLFQDKRK